MTRLVTSLPVTEKSVANGNWDTSRAPIDRVIIHTMVGYADSADARFNNSTSQVSAHYGVLLNGSIWHWVDEDNTAYQCGNYAMNQRSIGIEHEDGGNYDGIRPDTLYSASAKLLKDICSFYNIPIDRTHVLKHSEVIATGCPDALDIDRIIREANAESPIDSCPKDRDDNWNMNITIFQALGVQLDPNDKPGSVKRATDEIKRLQNPPPAPDPVIPPSTPPSGAPDGTSVPTETPPKPNSGIIGFIEHILSWFKKG